MSNTHFIQRKECPSCGRKDLSKVYEKNYNDPVLKQYLDDFYNKQGGVEHEYLEDAKYVLMECNDCKLVFQEFIPNDGLMYRLYEQWIDPAQIAERGKNDGYDYYQRYASEIINIIASFKKKPYYLSFLDFGMGWGKWCLMAKAFGCDVYGTELSDERINYARKNGIKVITWADIPNNRFDFINTEQVFEHIPTPLETMRYLSLSLKPEGLIKISIPNGNAIKDKLKVMDWKAARKAKNSLMVVAPLEHINCYSTESVMAMAKECGLEHVEVPFKYVGFRTVRDLVKSKIRPYYYKYMKKGDITLFFKKSS